MIKEILDTYSKGSKLAFKCGSPNGIRRFVDICYDEKIEFSKSSYNHVFKEILKDECGYTSYLEQFLTNDQDTVILFFKASEIQFYVRRESDTYSDTNEYEVFDFIALMRDEKLNKLLS